MNMKIYSLSIVLATFLFSSTAVRCEITREEVIDLPCSRLVYDFLTALKKRYSMASSKVLFPFIITNNEVRAIEADKNAWVETVLVEEILNITEEVGDEIVTAVVRTEENSIEVWTFRCALKKAEALLVPSKPRDSALPRLTPWIIRIANIGDADKKK